MLATLERNKGDREPRLIGNITAIRQNLSNGEISGIALRWIIRTLEKNRDLRRN